MIYRDRRQMDKLRRRNSILSLIIFFLLVWIKNLYDDKEWLSDENSSYFYSNLKKDEQLKKLTLKIDSISKSQIKPEIVNTEKIRKKIKKDSVPIVTDTIIIQEYTPKLEPEKENIERKDSLNE